MLLKRILSLICAFILAAALSGCAGDSSVSATPTPSPGPTPNLSGLTYYQKYELMESRQATVSSFLSYASSNTDVAMAFISLMTGQFDLASQMVSEQSADILSLRYLVANPCGSSEADLLIGGIYEHPEVYMLTVESIESGSSYAVGVAGKRVVAYFPLYITGVSEEIEQMRQQFSKYLTEPESTPLPGDTDED
ncbi:MAG: hypothetical protein ACOYJD_02070 [Christensenellales bacterium]